MTRADLLSLARVYVPEAPTTVISDANAVIILNNAAQEFVRQTDCFPTSTDFTCTDGDRDYLLSTVASTFSKIHRAGLWWLNSSSKWIQLEATTLPYMWKNFPNWLNDSEGDPARYWIDGNILYVHPTPDTTLASGFRLYHYAKATDTSATTHYMFTGSTVQIPWLAPWEEVLLEYYKWKVNNILGYDAKAENARQMFYANCGKAKQEFLARPDLIPQMKTRGAGNMNHFNSMYGG